MLRTKVGDAPPQRFLRQRQGRIQLADGAIGRGQVVHAAERFGIVGTQEGGIGFARAPEELDCLLRFAQT